MAFNPMSDSVISIIRNHKANAFMESTINIDVSTKNTDFLDFVVQYFKTHGFQLLEKNYEAVVLYQNDSWEIFRCNRANQPIKGSILISLLLHRFRFPVSFEATAYFRM